MITYFKNKRKIIFDKNTLQCLQLVNKAQILNCKQARYNLPLRQPILMLIDRLEKSQIKMNSSSLEHPWDGPHSCDVLANTGLRV